MKHRNQILLWITTLLVVCATPLIFFSEQRQEQIADLFSGQWATQPSPAIAALIVVLFAGDIFLPIPATAVCAVAGKLFGVVSGSLLCWIGLNISAAVGYGLARFIGWPVINRFSSRETVAEIKTSVDRFGIWPLVAMRPIPVLAEASILLLGLYRYPLKRFWPAVALSNFVVAVVFVSIGNWFGSRDQTWLGILIASVLPILMLVLWLAFQTKRQSTML